MKGNTLNALLNKFLLVYPSLIGFLKIIAKVVENAV